jgi:hypothetical protein
MTTPDKTATAVNKVTGVLKSMQRPVGVPPNKKPINTISELRKVTMPGASKRSKKNAGSGSNNTKSAHQAVLEMLENNDNSVIKGPPENSNNFVMVPSDPEIGRDANNIMSYSMNSGVGLDKNWTVLFAHDVIIPVDNPMAPVLALSRDISKPSSGTPTGPIGRTSTNLFDEPSNGNFTIQDLVKRKAETLMQENNINLKDLFMDRS